MTEGIVLSNYDFKNVSPYEFETIIRDLLSQKEDKEFENFSSGPDGGIDLRHISPEGKLTIVQCKHYAGSNFSKLKNNFKKYEVAKAKSLNPDRYILATSLPLTHKNKDTLVEISDGLISRSEDVISCETINLWLTEFPRIEKRHMSLWANSSAVLEKIFNSGIYSYSEYQKQEMQKKIGFYVKSECFYEAQDIIKSQKFCIIAGPPGVGKTSLAEILMIDYLTQGYDIVRISSDIKEAFDAFNENEKTVYYYDDFLGQTGLDEKLNKNEDQRIIDFCNLCKNSSNSLFILTTREYILERAKDIYGKIKNSNIDIKKCTIDISRYKLIDRARILYNHLYFSELGQDYFSEIINNNNYSKIISHPSFNPRVIEWMTIFVSRENIPPEKYIQTFMDTLQTPLLIWKDAFSQHITPGARILVLSNFLMPPGSSLSDLKYQYEILENLYCDLYRTPKPRNFNRNLKEVEGNFIHTFQTDDDIKIIFHNPSIRDFIASEVSADSDLAKCLILSCRAFDQLTNFYNSFQNHIGNEFFSDMEMISIFQNKLVELFSSDPVRPTYFDKYKPHLFLARIIFILNCNFPSPIPSLIKLVKEQISQFKFTINSVSGLITIDKLLDSLQSQYKKYEIDFALLAKEIFEELLFSLDDVSRILSLSRIYKNYHTVDIEDLEKRTGIVSNLKKTIEEEADYHIDDVDELWSLRSNIVEIGLNFDIDLDRNIWSVDYNIEQIEHPEDDEPESEKNQSPTNSDDLTSEISIMFNSLVT